MSSGSTTLDDIFKGHSAVQAYKDVEAATGLFSDLLVHEVGIPDHQGDLSVFDIACGTGAATASVYSALPEEKSSTTKVLAGDISEPFIEFLKERGRRAGWTGLETKVVDGANVDAPAASFTHILLNFGLMFTGPALLPSCLSLLAPNGSIGITTWHILPWHDWVTRAAALLTPNPPRVPPQSELRETYHFTAGEFESPEYMKRVMEEAGFVDVRSEVRECKTATSREVVLRTLGIPLKLMGAGWEEGVAEKIQGKILELMGEEFGEGPAELRWVGVVTVGRRAG